MAERYGVVLGLCLAAALVGGVVGRWMGQTAAVPAQESPAATKILAAQEVRLVDSAGAGTGGPCVFVVGATFIGF